MTKEERNNRLNKIAEIYINNEYSLQELSEQFEISVPCISRFLKSKNIEIKKATNRNNFLEEAVAQLKNSSLEEVSSKYGITKEVLQLAVSGLTKTEYKKRIINMAIKEYVETALYDRSIVKIAKKYGINKKLYQSI